MAAAHQSSENRTFKFESIRIEWTNYFEKEHRRDLSDTAKDFFSSFHRNHRQLVFLVAKIFDGTTHVLVNNDDYIEIKNELERETGKSVPDIRPIDRNDERGFKVIKTRTFSSESAYLEYIRPLISQNKTVRER